MFDLGETDIITFPGFCSFEKSRKHFIRKSGGISIYFKNEHSKYIKKIDTDSEYVLWFEIDKKIALYRRKLNIRSCLCPS